MQKRPTKSLNRTHASKPSQSTKQVKSYHTNSNVTKGLIRRTRTRNFSSGDPPLSEPASDLGSTMATQRATRLSSTSSHQLTGRTPTPTLHESAKLVEDYNKAMANNELVARNLAAARAASKAYTTTASSSSRNMSNKQFKADQNKDIDSVVSKVQHDFHVALFDGFEGSEGEEPRHRGNTAHTSTSMNPNQQAVKCATPLEQAAIREKKAQLSYELDECADFHPPIDSIRELHLTPQNEDINPDQKEYCPPRASKASYTRDQHDSSKTDHKNINTTQRQNFSTINTNQLEKMNKSKFTMTNDDTGMNPTTMNTQQLHFTQEEPLSENGLENYRGGNTFDPNIYSTASTTSTGAQQHNINASTDGQQHNVSDKNINTTSQQNNPAQKITDFNQTKQSQQSQQSQPQQSQSQSQPQHQQRPVTQHIKYFSTTKIQKVPGEAQNRPYAPNEHKLMMNFAKDTAMSADNEQNKQPTNQNQNQRSQQQQQQQTQNGRNNDVSNDILCMGVACQEDFENVVAQEKHDRETPSSNTTERSIPHRHTFPHPTLSRSSTKATSGLHSSPTPAYSSKQFSTTTGGRSKPLPDFDATMGTFNPSMTSTARHFVPTSDISDNTQDMMDPEEFEEIARATKMSSRQSSSDTPHQTSRGSEALHSAYMDTSTTNKLADGLESAADRLASKIRHVDDTAARLQEVSQHTKESVRGLKQELGSIVGNALDDVKTTFKQTAYDVTHPTVDTQEGSHRQQQQQQYQQHPSQSQQTTTATPSPVSTSPINTSATGFTPSPTTSTSVGNNQSVNTTVNHTTRRQMTTQQDNRGNNQDDDKSALGKGIASVVSKAATTVASNADTIGEKLSDKIGRGVSKIVQDESPALRTAGTIGKVVDAVKKTADTIDQIKTTTQDVQSFAEKATNNNNSNSNTRM